MKDSIGTVQWNLPKIYEATLIKSPNNEGDSK